MEAGLLIGIDIGGTSLKGGIVDAVTGVILHSDSAILPEAALDRTPGRVIGMVDIMLSRLVHAAGAARSDISALGCGCPGLVRGGIVYAAGNFPSWQKVNLTSELAALLPSGTRLAVINDANAAALAEAWVGVGRDAPAQSIVVLCLGTGIGVGALVHGVPLLGNIEGGHHIIHPNGRSCVCGQAGCFEAYCSAPAIAARVNEALRQNAQISSLLGFGRTLTCEDLFDVSNADDKLCMAVMAEVVHDLALGCLNICRMLDPQALILAGGVSGAGERLVDLLRKELQRIWWTMGDLPTVAIAQAGTKSGIIGAAAAALRLAPSDVLERLE